MPIQHILIILLVGLLAGTLSGLLGIGGAVIIIPVLVFLGYEQQTAQGTTLVMMVLPIGAMAAWQYYQQGQVDMKVALMLAGAFFIGGFLGAKFALDLPQLLMKRIFAIFLIIVAVKMLITNK